MHDLDGPLCQRAPQHHRQCHRKAVDVQGRDHCGGPAVPSLFRAAAGAQREPSPGAQLDVASRAGRSKPAPRAEREDFAADEISLIVVVSGYDVVAAQTVHARKSYDHPEIRSGHRYVDVLSTSRDGRVGIDYGRFHDTLGPSGSVQKSASLLAGGGVIHTSSHR